MYLPEEPRQKYVYECGRYRKVHYFLGMMEIVWYLLYSIYYGLVYLLWELPRGLDFYRMHDTYENSPNSVYYQTMPFRQVQKYFEGYVNPDDVFLDAGCGKGYMLYCAKRLGYSDVSGFEINEKLINVARKNLRKLDIKGVNIIRADAKDFTDLDRYNVIYLFNPFYAYVMKRFVQNIVNSLRRAPRKLLIIYANPVDNAIFKEAGGFKLLETRKFPEFSGAMYVNYYTYDAAWETNCSGLESLREPRT